MENAIFIDNFSYFMYTAYFALNDLPFSIAPDPDYLFMSDRHREALSHLTYGLGTTGGFVLLTGEVGTGKTTISRRLMEQLPENTQVAFILNPTLSSQELLATICDQLKVRYRKTGATLKTLTDKIQEKLLKNHQANINTLLIIDEAQHLQAEVLEQLRLLTNFETNTKKLLQVILIGQPELQQLLQRRDLRQLAQRITARYHLMPLNKQEVAQYIQHRLSVADCYRVIFDKSALSIIHQLSQGIPRLINLLCDRSLWIAYGDSKSVVDKKTVIKASAEALGEEYQPVRFWHKAPIKIAASVVVLSGVLGGGVWWGQNGHFQQTKIESSLTQELSQKIQTDKPTELTSPDQSKGLNELEQPEKAAKNIVKTQRQNSLPDPLLNHPDSSDTGLSTKNSNVVETEKPLILGYKSDEYRQQLAKGISTNKAEQYKVTATDGVSDKLLQKFQNAINETEVGSGSDLADTSVVNKNIQTLSDMPAWLQKSLPAMKFDMHIFASDGKGWVRVNGKDAHEGNTIAKNVVLEKILPQQVILNFKGEEFSMPALSSW